MSITVAIVEDDAGIRDALVRILGRSRDFRCVGWYSNGEEALRELPALKPDYATLLRRLDLNGEASAPVAASLGITRNNLIVRLHRARRQLRERLEQTCRLCAKHGCLDCHCDQPGTERN